MKRMSIIFLAFLTFWISTWMVTDIHDWSIEEQPHPLFSIQQDQVVADTHAVSQIQHLQAHCNICSYDHGGHMGQTLAAIFFVAPHVPVQSLFKLSHYPDFWYSRSTAPQFRPPIV